MSTELAPGGWITKLAMAAASASLIGGGSTVLALHRNDAVQDEKLVHVVESLQKVEKLDEKLDTTLRKVDLLNARLDYEEGRRVPRNE